MQIFMILYHFYQFFLNMACMIDMLGAGIWYLMLPYQNQKVEQQK